ncbi:F-box only protein 25 [Willisornis vidua]|uniref:F-box only protein 25 n=1 Tax=Willisornis vidua TaxID=1566151 RepID=A0ABQ9D2T9_9PASS|nr:F-box only protein 25 [Willisornis vidua]
MDNGIECTISTLGDDTKSGAADMLEGRDVIQKDLDRTEVGVSESHEVQQGKVQRPAPGWGTPKYKHRMGGEWIENSPEQKDSGVLVDRKVNMSQQCVLAAQKAKHVLGCIKRSVASSSGGETMPFLGQDWRSPGWRWVKTEDGWKRCEPFSPALEDGNNQLNDIRHTVIITEDDEKDVYGTEDCFYREKWIYVHKESTKERHGYCTLGEAFNRLDFSSAIQDIRRFNYVVKLLQLIAKSQLTSLSGAAQKNYFNILDKIVRKVMEDQYNPRLIKDLLQDLSSTLCILIRGVGKSVLVGNINIWICRLETVLLWQQQLKNLQMNKQVNNGLTLSDLPLHMLNNILYRFSDGWDIITLGQVTPTLYMLSEDRQLWKKLCQYHFAEKQDTGHPCTASDPNTCLMPVSPQHFIDLFKF